MTHEELLYRINWASERYHDTDGRAQYFDALRAVVLRHKLKIDMNGYGSCEECSRTAYYNVPWPCLTIEDIARELML